MILIIQIKKWIISIDISILLGIFSFKSEQIVVHFHSDSSVNDRGFEVTLRQRECPSSTTTTAPSSSCDQVFDSKQFILVSPNHPRDYDNELNCKYVRLVFLNYYDLFLFKNFLAISFVC